MGNRILHPFHRHTAEVVPHLGHVVVRLSGEITSKNADQIGEDLCEVLLPRTPVLEIDLTRVTCLSGDGCTALFMALLAARPHGTRAIVTQADSRTRATLTRLGLTRVLDVYEEAGPYHS
ncbi:STAS domain-containing protein [Streptomyces sp. NBC_01764]|uniref:STAS domain-containing protein n=1 Tax=Streptomyces sp. NBC_01764 TaxID=2975935 RepID=UPI0022544F55|nr:STAS domain-containing protein [Streptomyces sp. NBC_01764]MCX4404175.1 STAS domain-containing protein [Streptomyces sp. NBC_01764]